MYLLYYYLIKKLDSSSATVLKRYQPSDSLKNQARLEVLDTHMKLYPRTVVVECDNDLRELYRAAVLDAPVDDRATHWRLLARLVAHYQLREAEKWVDEYEATGEEAGI